MEHQSLANLHILGSRMGDCAKAMLYRLSDKLEGDAQYATTKFKYVSLVFVHYYYCLL